MKKGIRQQPELLPAFKTFRVPIILYLDVAASALADKVLLACSPATQFDNAVEVSGEAPVELCDEARAGVVVQLPGWKFVHGISRCA
jgi:hypothetical protein